MFLFKNFIPAQRYFYVKKHVLIFSTLKKQEQLSALNDFTNEYLKPDVVLVLKLLATNVNGLVVSELVKHLWDSFIKSRSSSELDKELVIDNDSDFNPNIEENTDDENPSKTSYKILPRFPLNDNQNEEPKEEFRVVSSILKNNRSNSNESANGENKYLIKSNDNVINRPTAMV